jgi:uncharacterized membrane protein YedE/YeeE
VKAHLGGLTMGLLLGVALTMTGFVDYGAAHRMFVFQDLRLLFTFAGAVAISAAGFMALTRGAKLPRRPIRRGTVVGAVIFGIGWAITGACPAVTLVQIANGYLPALATLGGVLLGLELCSVVRARWLQWPVDSCDE